MSKTLSEKEIADLETECSIDVVKINEDLDEGVVDIHFKYVEDITTEFIISEKTGKIAFTKYLNGTVYRKACKAVKEHIKKKNKYGIRPVPKYTKVSERTIVREITIPTRNG